MTFHIISHRKTRQPKAKSRLAVGTLSIPTCFPRGNSSMDKHTANRPREIHAATTRFAMCLVGFPFIPISGTLEKYVLDAQKIGIGRQSGKRQEETRLIMQE